MGLFSAELDAKNPKTILLFYMAFESDSFVKYDRYLKRVIRPVYNLLHNRQKKTGFDVSFDRMKLALTRAGYTVRVNNYRLARANPRYPVGIIGYPSIMEGWSLPNPAILGPSLYDHPMLAPNLFDDPRFREYVCLAPWTCPMYDAVYKNRCFSWFAGMDMNEWPDLSTCTKKYDFLLYDKVRWDHDFFEKSLIEPIKLHLAKSKVSFQLMRYGNHDHATFRKALTESRSVLFLCEHETQGLAYQEALASGLAILAWDRGFWADPLWQRFGDSAPSASSVPFFDDTCGKKFVGIEDFPVALAEFMQSRDKYTPRAYVRQNLSLEESAKTYADHYFKYLG